MNAVKASKFAQTNKWPKCHFIRYVPYKTVQDFLLIQFMRATCPAYHNIFQFISQTVKLLAYKVTWNLVICTGQLLFQVSAT